MIEWGTNNRESIVVSFRKTLIWVTKRKKRAMAGGGVTG